MPWWLFLCVLHSDQMPKTPDLIEASSTVGCATLHLQQAKGISGSSPAKSILLGRSFSLAGWWKLVQLNTEPSFLAA